MQWIKATVKAIEEHSRCAVRAALCQGLADVSGHVGVHFRQRAINFAAVGGETASPANAASVYHCLLNDPTSGGSHGEDAPAAPVPARLRTSVQRRPYIPIFPRRFPWPVFGLRRTLASDSSGPARAAISSLTRCSCRVLRISRRLCRICDASDSDLAPSLTQAPCSAQSPDGGACCHRNKAAN